MLFIRVVDYSDFLRVGCPFFKASAPRGDFTSCVWFYGFLKKVLGFRSTGFAISLGMLHGGSSFIETVNLFYNGFLTKVLAVDFCVPGLLLFWLSNSLSSGVDIGLLALTFSSWLFSSDRACLWIPSFYYCIFFEFSNSCSSYRILSLLAFVSCSFSLINSSSLQIVPQYFLSTAHSISSAVFLSFLLLSNSYLCLLFSFKNSYRKLCSLPVSNIAVANASLPSTFILSFVSKKPNVLANKNSIRTIKLSWDWRSVATSFTKLLMAYLKSSTPN